jgi:acetylglutamate kinase
MKPAVRVYKVGGSPAEDPEMIAGLAREARRSQAAVLIVHGGGGRVNTLLLKLAIESHFSNGRRQTSAAAMEVVEMVLSGPVNKSLAAGLTAAGLPAAGISGRDAGLLRADLAPELGRVGTRVRVKPDLVLALWRAGIVPVVSPVSEGPVGEPLNVNADEAALGLAAALGARALLYLSDVDGVLLDGRLAPSLSAEDARRLIAAGTISGGMALKVEAALAAAGAGIPDVVIAGRGRLTQGFPGTRIEGGVAAEARA